MLLRKFFKYNPFTTGFYHIWEYSVLHDSDNPNVWFDEPSDEQISNYLDDLFGAGTGAVEDIVVDPIGTIGDTYGNLGRKVAGSYDGSFFKKTVNMLALGIGIYVSFALAKLVSGFLKK